MTAVLLLLTLGICVATLFRPWVGVAGYYLLAIMAPQSIWTWVFGDLRISLMVAASTFLGTMIGVLTKKLSLSRINHRFSYALGIILIFANLSHILTPYKNFPIPGNMLNPSEVLSIFNKAIIFYFIAIICIDTKERLKWMIYMLLAIFIYYTYWANKIYLTGQLWLYNSNGRLSGPPGLYIDENTFGMLFVVGSAFIYFMGLTFEKKIWRYALWSVLPFLWHAIFLTESRGALVAMGCVAIFIALRSRSKAMGIGIFFAFLVALVWQGQSILNRATQTAEVAEVSDESVVDPRILSWTTGFNIIAKYPVLGAGFARFQQASLEMSNHHAYVAHNTFLQFAANNGLICGVFYVLLFWWAYKLYAQYRVALTSRPGSDFYIASLDAIVGGLIGFFISAVFLDLMIYEILYCCLALLVAWRYSFEEALLRENSSKTDDQEPAYAKA